MPVRPIRGLREIVPANDALIVDRWGVIHSGVELRRWALSPRRGRRAAGGHALERAAASQR